MGKNDHETTTIAVKFLDLESNGKRCSTTKWLNDLGGVANGYWVKELAHTFIHIYINLFKIIEVIYRKFTTYQIINSQND